MADSEDDWLSEPFQGQGAREDPLVDREWEKIQTKYNDAGYREGITDGKLSTLQNGFDQGFCLSVPPSRALGLLRGRANALLQHQLSTSALAPTDQANKDIIDELRNLIRDLGRVKRDDVLPVDTERIEHEKEDERARNEDNQFELEPTEKREMESLENALEDFGRATKRQKNGNGHGEGVEEVLGSANGNEIGQEVKERREAELLGWLKGRLGELEQRALRG